MKGFFFDEDQFKKLRKLQSQLHGGTDRERDYGHRLWLVCNEVELLSTVEVSETTGEIDWWTRPKQSGYQKV